METNENASPKSFVTAVVLTFLFGILGIHHFYCGRWLLGLFDLSLSVTGIALLYMGSYWPILGIVILIGDYIHSIYYIVKLFSGKYTDGNGRIIPVPGQSSNQNN